MPVTALVGLIVPAVVLAWSGVRKLRYPDLAAQRSFLNSAGFGWVPDVLLRVHPWTELALAAGLLLTTDRPLVVFAALSLGLLLAYLALVVFSWHAQTEVGCACFGDVGEPVGPRTVARNVLLVAFAAVGLWAALGGLSLVDLRDPAALSWTLACLACAALTWLVLPPRTAPDLSSVEQGDYVRLPIPGALVRDSEEVEHTLVELATARAQLLILVSQSCGSCERVVDLVPSWRVDLPVVDIRLLTPVSREVEFADLLAKHPNSLYDARGEATRTLGLTGTPSAVLLGADGWLAGGPVAGWEQVIEFVTEIKAELDANSRSDTNAIADTNTVHG